MRIYLASRYSRRVEMLCIRSKLEALGHTVISRWLETEWVNRPNQSSAAPPEYREKYALIELEDIDKCTLMINFTEPPGIANAGRGGRHVEFGYALAKKKTIIVVGHRENLFHEHPSVLFADNDYAMWKIVLELAAGEDR